MNTDTNYQRAAAMYDAQGPADPPEFSEDSDNWPKDAVAAGMAWLDARIPDWPQRLRPTLGGNILTAICIMRLRNKEPLDWSVRFELGFDCRQSDADQLETEWQLRCCERLGISTLDV